MKAQAARQNDLQVTVSVFIFLSPLCIFAENSETFHSISIPSVNVRQLPIENPIAQERRIPPTRPR
jgi:hypothetical protein